MKRFIRYLYEYEQGRRMRNVGFVKVDQDDEECVVHIHGKGLRLEGEKELKIYLFFQQDGKCIGLPQGSIENVNPAVNYQLRYTKEDVGESENYAYIEGIIMENRSHRKYAAVWNDMPVNVNTMQIWEAPEVMEAVEPQEVVELQGVESEAAEPEVIEPEVVEQCVKPEKKYMKIQRQEIAALPRCEWKLSNNSFLLHGYYNYHHLILIEDTDNKWLGVPGTYHCREAKAAESFGFPQFVKIEEVDIDLSIEERDENSNFGYWCRHIRS